MNVDNIPRNVKQIMQDKELSIHKKMVAFMAFMPKLPSDPKNDQAWKDNEKIGEQIYTLCSILSRPRTIFPADIQYVIIFIYNFEHFFME